jgi:hypothetical protein
MRSCVFIFGFIITGAFAQTSPDTYWIQFTDKVNTPYSVDQPEQFLSARAIQRRVQQNIPIEASDLPVDPAYIAGVLAQGDVQLHNRSKWFNAITIRTQDQQALEAISQLPFVFQVRSSCGNAERRIEKVIADPARDLDYGPSILQMGMMNGQLLHELSQGENMLIGVLDSGFENANTSVAFTELYGRNGVLLTRDLVAHDGDVYNDHNHGRSVLSCMAAVIPGALIGTAPGADYVLVRTEDASTEFLVEEDNWIAGAELCDSIGCDVINTSLGYTLFDDPSQDHSYWDMDGNTTRISIAAGMASSKGMITVVSAGNLGNDDWYFIGAPADAHNILAVGGVGGDEQPAPFSSHGPSVDGRVKPDVSAMGMGTLAADWDGTVVAVNGTSFASPLVAGLAACLWKLHPWATASQVMQAIRESSSHYDDPQPQLGHGIPDFMLAHQLLQMLVPVQEMNGSAIATFPNPFTDRLFVRPSMEGTVAIQVQDLMGRTIFASELKGDGDWLTDARLGSLPAGTYLLLADQNGRRFKQKLLKAE